MQQQRAQAALIEIHNTFSTQAPTLYQNIPAYHELLALQQNYNFGSGDRLEKRIATLQEMQIKGALYEARSYTVTYDVSMLLQQNGCDVNNYRACCGNQIQQLVHQDCLILLEQIADISPLSYIYEHKNSFVQCIDAARDYNQAGLKALKSGIITLNQSINLLLRSITKKFLYRAQ